MMMRLFFIICFVTSFLFFLTRIVYSGPPVNSQNLTKENVQPAIMSVAWGGIRTESDIVDLSDIEKGTIKIIDVHQEGNTALVYCNFTNKKGEKLFGYIPLIRLKNSLIWVNRDNWTILANN